MAETVMKAAVFTVQDQTKPAVISMEAVMGAVIQVTQELHVTRVSIFKERVKVVTC